MPKYNSKEPDFISPENKKFVKKIIRYNIEDKVKKIIENEAEYIKSFKKRAPY